MFVRDVKFVKVDSEASMRQMGFVDEAIIYTMDNKKLYRFDLANNEFIPITLTQSEILSRILYRL